MDYPEPSKVLRAGAIVLVATVFILLAGCRKPVAQDLIPTTETPLADAHVQGGKEKVLAWNLKTLLDPYREIGSQKLLWNEAASRALIEFARQLSDCLESNEPADLIIETNCEAAVGEGCNDPLIDYLNVRYGADSRRMDAKTLTKQYCEAAQALQNSAYPSIRKYYAWMRFFDQLNYTYDDEKDIPPDMKDVTTAPARDALVSALKDKTMPPSAVYAASEYWLREWPANPDYFDCVQEAVMKNWPREGMTYLLKGEFYLSYAWEARGTGGSDTVTPAQWLLFSNRLASAETALNRAWELDPKNPAIAVKMIKVAMGQEKDRATMERWFGRAMALDPDDYDACGNKLLYLYPQWYGSREAMIQFGHECVSTNWGGQVPLILADAHWDYYKFFLKNFKPQEAQDYWKQPDVWPDLKMSFDRFFELNPDATGKYNNYAWYAYQCGQWDAFNELLLKFTWTNYDYFGGKEAFDEMVRNAREQAANPQKPSPAQN